MICCVSLGLGHWYVYHPHSVISLYAILTGIVTGKVPHIMVKYKIVYGMNDDDARKRFWYSYSNTMHPTLSFG